MQAETWYLLCAVVRAVPSHANHCITAWIGQFHLVNLGAAGSRFVLSKGVTTYSYIPVPPARFACQLRPLIRFNAQAWCWHGLSLQIQAADPL